MKDSDSKLKRKARDSTEDQKDAQTTCKLEPELRAQISLEEQYRSEIRRELTAKSDTGSRVWGFINSQFGLWLLSSVILAMLAQGWQMRNAARQEEERVDRIFMEIAHRAMRARDEIHKIHSARESTDAAPVLNALRVNFSKPDGELTFAFPEFRDWSTESLLFQLQSIGTPRDRKSAGEVQRMVNSIAEELGRPDGGGPTLNASNSLELVIKKCKRS